MPVILYNDQEINCSRGKTILQAFEKIRQQFSVPVVAALYNNRLCGLNSSTSEDGQIEPVLLNSTMGLRVYERTINLLISKAAKDLFPDDQLNLKFSLNKGVYGEFEKKKPLKSIDLELMAEKFQSFISNKVTIKEKSFTHSQVKKIFENQNESYKTHSVDFYQNGKIQLYGFGDYWSYLPGPLLPHTGILKQFEIIPYDDGFIVRFPDLIEVNQLPAYENQRKVFEVYSQFSRWLEILNIKESCNLNQLIKNGDFSDFIKVCEAIQEKEISDIADTVCTGRPRPRLILISGPSSSGKTTFSKRLRIQLIVNGVRPILISLDNYYKNREVLERESNGTPDLEALEALDLELFNSNVLDLLAGKNTKLPQFSFIQGKRLPGGQEKIMTTDEVIVVEGIHGLNPELSRQVPSSEKFRIYVSPLTPVPIDHTNRFPTAVNRLIRRIIRDSKYRGYQPERTIRMWEDVRKGEEKNIFPFQENADVLFNTSLIYELNIFKSLIGPLLETISPYEKEYAVAQYLTELLKNYQSFPCDEIPPTSILREFIGGSSFNY